MVSTTTFTTKCPVAATESATRVFWESLFRCLAEDLGLRRLAADEALQLADVAYRYNRLARPDRLAPTLGRARPPLEQQARGDAVKPADGEERHVGPCT
jgi:hypothetical protein